MRKPMTITDLMREIDDNLTTFLRVNATVTAKRQAAVNILDAAEYFKPWAKGWIDYLNEQLRIEHADRSKKRSS